jgi:hypothetical protein
MEAEWFPNSAIVFDKPEKFHLITRDRREIAFVEGEITQRGAGGSQ